ncbi:MAG: hypothetical protein KDD19_21885, partial [Phaeodactylibacter sp.]|nr:hypothetical protein [Phaeodactylibacter sp.]
MLAKISFLSKKPPEGLKNYKWRGRAIGRVARRVRRPSRYGKARRPPNGAFGHFRTRILTISLHSKQADGKEKDYFCSFAGERTIAGYPLLKKTRAMKKHNFSPGPA